MPFIANPSGSLIGSEVCKLLGLDAKHVKRIVIDLSAGELATVTLYLDVADQTPIVRTFEAWQWREVPTP